MILAAMLAACSQSKPPSESGIAQPADSMPAAESMPAPPPAEEPMPAVSAPTTPATGSMVVYACDDGSGVTVTYDKYTALVKLPSGSTTLSRADSASGDGEEAYLGEELSLYRNGNSVRLENAGKSHICTGRS
jgi:hypothetical protein